MILQISRPINQNHNNFILMEKEYGQFKYIGFFKQDGRYRPGVYQLNSQGISVFITLSTFCKSKDDLSDEPIEIIFSKKKNWHPTALHLEQTRLSNQFIIIKTSMDSSTKIGIQKSFQKFSLELDSSQLKWFENPPKLIPVFDYNKFPEQKMLALGIRDQYDSSISEQWLKEPFDVLESKAGVYFIEQKQSQQLLFYGFYNLASKDKPSFDNFLYKESLDEKESKMRSRQQVSRQDSEKRKVFKEDLVYPRNSVCKLRFFDGEGTASILVNKQGQCKHLITCAHNFYGTAINKQKDLYIYQRDKHKDKIQIYRHVGDTIQEINVQIKNIHMPEQYKKFVQSRFEQLRAEQTVQGYKLKMNKKHIRFYEWSFYDIAIIELQESFIAKQGFQIRPPRKLEQIKLPFQLTGFPIMDEHQVKTQKDCMYYDSTQLYLNHKQKAFVRLSDKFGGRRLILHNLFAITGNSGSPIYGQIGQNSCYLLGIHIFGVLYLKTNEQTINGWEQPFGQINCAIYLYSQNISTWLKSKEQFKEFIVSE